jgi:cyanophycinase-like exopeptidase
VLGLDESTGVVGRNGQFTVVGGGALTVIADGELRVHPANTQVTLDISDDPAPRYALAAVVRFDPRVHEPPPPALCATTQTS